MPHGNTLLQQFPVVECNNVGARTRDDPFRLASCHTLGHSNSRHHRKPTRTRALLNLPSTLDESGNSDAACVYMGMRQPGSVRERLRPGHSLSWLVPASHAISAL